MKLGNLIQSADFKAEKHVPVIETPEKVKKDEWFEVNVCVGKEIPHPNTLEHHIESIELYFKPDNGKFAVLLGRYKFFPTFSEPSITAKIKIVESGTLIAMSYCNIHGLWEGNKKIEVK